MRIFVDYFGSFHLARLILERGIAAVYCIAFLCALRQCKPLLGERGLLPIPAFLKERTFWQAPSIFHWKYSDPFFAGAAWTGLLVALPALCGALDHAPLPVAIALWLLLYVLYLSIVNVGQTFYGFGWESMLLEAGFFAAFLGTPGVAAPLIPILLLRWMLFRTEMGAGLIKLRHDPCWRRLTCLFYHYETQPLPNPLSWYFHRQPALLHRAAVLFSHFVQVVVPFFLFAPRPLAAVAAALIIFHQLWLIVSGNYSWLNWLTVILGAAGLDDRTLSHWLPLHLPPSVAPPLGFAVLTYLVGAVALVLSVQPALNLVARSQRMNFNYNSFHLLGAYGAFGSVGRTRYQVVLEGTEDAVLTPATRWREYQFKALPVDPRQLPRQVAPYHLRLDWQFWFLPFSVIVREQGIFVPGYELWFVRFIEKLLAGDADAVRLLGKTPFPTQPPAHLRAQFYRYRYTGWRERKQTGAWWSRSLLGTYLPPVSLRTLRQREEDR